MKKIGIPDTLSLLAVLAFVGYLLLLVGLDYDASRSFRGTKQDYLLPSHSIRPRSPPLAGAASVLAVMRALYAAPPRAPSAWAIGCPRVGPPSASRALATVRP